MMAWCKTAVTPLLMYWSYCSLATGKLICLRLKDIKLLLSRLEANRITVSISIFVFLLQTFSVDPAKTNVLNQMMRLVSD